MKERANKLLFAREIVISQFARYELQKQKIELVRLQNNVAPLLFGLHRLTEIETENGLALIENTQREIGKIRKTLTDYVAIEFPVRVLPEKQNFLAQIEEAETGCKKLHESLLGKQAAYALRNISPVEGNLRGINDFKIAHSTETFNIQTMLTDFSESFDALEHEYQRLRAESNSSQNLLIE